MAFIVEMFYGKPNGAIVYGHDDDGELVVKEVIKSEEPPDPTARYFSCHVSVWEELLDLGQRYGWHPLGTVPEEPESNWWIGAKEELINNYKPIDWLRIKKV